MSRPDAERALNLYKAFGRQTDQVVQYLTVARQYESLTRLEVPKLKHAPTTLTSTFEEYLNDPDFEINRRQYLATKQATKGGSKSVAKSDASNPFDKAKKTDSSFPAPVSKPVAAANPPSKGPAPDLIDFFDSIETNQQPMAQPNAAPLPAFPNGYPQAQQYQQQNAFGQQQTGYNPFLPNQPQQTGIPQAGIQAQPQLPQAQAMQPDFTGAGFGGYTAQPQQPQLSQYTFQSSLSSIPQNGIASFESQQQPQPQLQQQQSLQPQQTSSNPFRQSMMATGAAPSSAITSSPPTGQSSNPFNRQTNAPSPQDHSSSPPANFQNSNSPFDLPARQTQQQELHQNSTFFSSPSQASQPQPSILPQRTGTNPFARNAPASAGPSPVSPLQQQQPLFPTATGSTNPFRQSQFVNQQTGLGWQNVPGGQGTFGGYNVNNVDTVPVFPRPGAS